MPNNPTSTNFEITAMNYVAIVFVLLALLWLAASAPQPPLPAFTPIPSIYVPGLACGETSLA